MQFLCHLKELNAQGCRGFELEQGSIFVVARQGQYYAYRNSCPHLGVELNWLEDQFLDRDEALIQCATHGALFIIESGECIAGPCLGASLEALEVSVRDEALYLKT